jgi:hypothetical protein
MAEEARGPRRPPPINGYHGRAVQPPEVLGHVGPEVVADGVGVPGSAGQQVLHAIGGRIAQVLGQLPTVLTLGVTEQPPEIPDGALPRLGPSEVLAKAFPDGRHLGGPAPNLSPRGSS